MTGATIFETRATEYSKGATKGDWQSVWSNFDQRRKAEGGDVAANEGAAETDGPDMFGSMAAE